MTPIILVSGLPGSGKTSVSHRLAHGFEKGFHLQVDLVRSMVVSGAISPETTTVWNSELEDQFRLERKAASALASTYAAAGYSVVIDDVAIPANILGHYENLDRNSQFFKILLFPSVTATLLRLGGRKDEFDDIFSEKLSMLHIYLKSSDKTQWNVIDTSDQTIDDTVQSVLGIVEMQTK